VRIRAPRLGVGRLGDGVEVVVEQHDVRVAEGLEDRQLPAHARTHKAVGRRSLCTRRWGLVHGGALYTAQGGGASVRS
jgi:hypothetical protein